MLHIILYQPEIPQNTGNIGRMCAITNSTLHLIHPLGFKITDKHLKRSGMDYWHDLNVIHHDNWTVFSNSPHKPERLFLFTTRAQRFHWDVKFQVGDGLLFGNEGHGVGEGIQSQIPFEYKLKIPHFNESLRSLNLSTAAGIATYEALRQIHHHP